MGRLITLTAGVGLSAIALGSAQAAEGTLRIGTNNWAENIAVANMWQQLLEEKGYEVELSPVSKSVLFSALGQGDLDLTLETWLPTTDAPFLEPYKDAIAIHEQWYEGTGMGLMVPDYVDIDSIEELGDRGDEFNATIVGIDAGSAIAALTDDVIDEYGLSSFHQSNSSEPAMMAALGDAYRHREPIVVTLWNPHWAFAQYDLKYLDDPQNIYGDSENIFWMSRQGFATAYPDVTAMLDAWHMDDDQLSGLMAEIEQAGDPAKGAHAWIASHRGLVDRWLSARQDDAD